MLRKIVPLFLMAIIAFWITSLEVTDTGAQPRASQWDITPVFTPQPTHMPYEQRLLYESQEKSLDGFSTNPPLASPVRGVPGDWWADVVIGEPNFAQITPNQVVGNKLFNPGGVHVDRSIVPNRVYVYDAGNSRIMGFSSLGACTAGSKAGQSCTSNSDCPGSTCTINGHKSADIILGQPSSNTSTCNADSGFQNYPDLPVPSASTLCGLRPESVSILEGGSMSTMATDPQGNLYHPDYFNNRVLRYNNPFAQDKTADYVWGQPDFAHADCNEGRWYGQPDNDSLCLAAPVQVGSIKSGVGVDASGNLWIADTQNHRVLRFPYSPALGAPAHQANLVLGQADFFSANSGNGLNQMNNPGSVRIDASGKVYVLDGADGWGTHGRLLVFIPPFSNGMFASQVFDGLGEPTGLELDASGRLWVNDTNKDGVLKLVNGQLQVAINETHTRHEGGLGIDRDGNVMLTGWDPQQVQLYKAPGFSSIASFLQADEYGSFNQLGPRGMTDPAGLEITDAQLIVADRSRLLFWNNPSQLTNNYPPANGVVGQPNFTTRPRWDPEFGRMRADTHGRLWVVKAPWYAPADVLAYQLPLVTGAQPVIKISPPLPLAGGGSFDWTTSVVHSGLVYQPECDCLWLSDRDYSRVFRIRNVSSSQRVVDIVLGQKRNASTLEIGTHCNQGRDSDDGYIHPTHPSQDSLCHPGGLAFDKRGNLFVSDHNLEVSGNWRLLEFNATSLPLSPASAVFALPASRVYGRNGSFTEPYCLDPLCGPWEPVFDPGNQMIIGFNGYLGPKFPQVYRDPLVNSLPYAALNDFFAHAYSARMDSQNNLYVLDLTRNHVLIYKANRPTISGNVGVAGATLSYTDGAAKTVTSLPDGSYSLTVSGHWAGTITPSHACMTFSPGSRSYEDANSNQTSQNYTPTLNAGAGCANVQVQIAGTTRGNFGIPAHGSVRPSFAGVNNGPVKIASVNAMSIMGAERLIYKVNGISTSFSEMMGLPVSQLDTIYWLPWYNNKELNTQLRIANVSATEATVHITIGGVEMTGSPYILAPGASTRKSYPGIDKGPVKIESNVDIVAAERVIYRVNNVDTSFAEMMALPNKQLDTIYWLPWYNNKDLNTQLRIANVSATEATVHVTIGGVEMTGSPYTLAPGASRRLSYVGIDKGPVKIESNVDIVAAERVIYKVNGVDTSFTELMALPNSLLNNIYWLPWYNNKDLDSQLRIANVSATEATVHVTIGGVEMIGSPYTLAPGASRRLSYVGINKGPVKVESNVNIVVAERVIYKVNNIATSFSEMMGLPSSLLNDTFWLPWYNNLELNTQLRFGAP